MKRLLISLILSAGSFNALAYQCPTGTYSSTDQFGNDICLNDAGNVVAVVGSIEKCPAFYGLNTDRYGNDYCGRDDMKAYDLSNGCLSFMMHDVDKYGNDICTLDGEAVVSLVKREKLKQ